MQIITEIKDSLLQIQMNRPEKKNALTIEMYKDMTKALQEASANSSIRAVVFCGQPDIFSSGNDLQDFMKGVEVVEESAVLLFLKELSAFPKPVVASVAGPAIGIGTTMLLHCDLIYAAKNSRFQLPFVNLALVPEAASSLMLPARIGYHRAAELLLLGEVFSADKALEYGLINGVVDNGEELSTALEAAKKLATKPPSAIRLSKMLLKQSTTEAVHQRIDDEAVHFSQCLKSPEAAEALKSFYEKRAPDFSKFN